MNGTAIVVGASSGIGAALARRLGLEGRKVAALARREDRLLALAEAVNGEVGGEVVFPFTCDVGDLAGAEGLFERIEQEVGEVDELHFVAGIMPDIGPGEFNTSKDQEQFLINTLGCIAWVNVAAGRFVSRGGGHIIGITSVAQDRGRVGRPGYCASKAGQDTFLESMRNRLWRHGVKVTTIRPGYVLTPMTEGMGLRGAITADRAAQLILRARNRGAAVAYVPFRWRLIMTAIRAVPSFLFRRLGI
jgi:NAD(P)-dependent dehydrogenase (short-subunit alcohol dehydrogenase family)